MGGCRGPRFSTHGVLFSKKRKLLRENTQRFGFDMGHYTSLNLLSSKSHPQLSQYTTFKLKKMFNLSYLFSSLSLVTPKTGFSSLKIPLIVLSFKISFIHCHKYPHSIATKWFKLLAKISANL